MAKQPWGSAIITERRNNDMATTISFHTVDDDGEDERIGSVTLDDAGQLICEPARVQFLVSLVESLREYDPDVEKTMKSLPGQYKSASLRAKLEDQPGSPK